MKTKVIHDFVSISLTQYIPRIFYLFPVHNSAMGGKQGSVLSGALNLWKLLTSMVCLFSLSKKSKVKQDYGSNSTLSKSYQRTLIISSGTAVMAVPWHSRKMDIVL